MAAATGGSPSARTARWGVPVAATVLGPLLLLLAVLGAGCGSDEAGEGRGVVRVAVVTDIGGVNDRGFNSLASAGLRRAERELGVEGRVLVSKSAADYVPNLSVAARSGYDLVIANGFLMGDAVAAAARRFPEVSFAIVDFPFEGLAGAPPNVRGLVFAEDEAGYLVGVGAARAAAGAPVSFVGGQQVPAVVRFLEGYRKGVAEAGGGRVLVGYSQDFVDQGKCAELALQHIAEGARVVFAAAGGCGLGALQAAREKGVWGIGVDSDQAFLGRHILTSATKRVDVAVLETIRAVVDGEFEGGGNSRFDATNGGVGFGRLSPAAPPGSRDAMIEALARLTGGRDDTSLSR